MKGFISMGTLAFITFLVALAALAISLFAPRPVLNFYPVKPVVTLAPTVPVVVSPTVEPTATPSATKSLLKTTVAPVKTVTVTTKPTK